MLDRIPTPGQEGRVLVTPEDGSTPFYAKIQMADNPTQAGDPFAKMTMLHDAVAAAYDKDNNAVPNDIFAVLSRFHKGLGNEYVWAKQEKSYVETLTSSTGYLPSSLGATNTTNVNLKLQASFEINDDGTFSLTGQSATITGMNSMASTLSVANYVGYYGVSSDGLTLYEITSNSTVSAYSATGGYGFRANNCKTYMATQTFELVCYVNSPDPNAYPPAEDDGYTYTALGQLGGFAKIKTGSYTGTGTYGSGNPNRLTFDEKPIAVMIYAPTQFADKTTLWPYGKTLDVAFHATSPIQMNLTWSANTVTWYTTSQDARKQLNLSGQTYEYLYIY